MVTSFRRTYCHTLRLPGLPLLESLSLRQATADSCLCRRPSDTQRQVCLRLLWGSLLLSFGLGTHKVLFVPSNHLWQVWGLILHVIGSLLPSCCSFSFALDCGVSFFGGFQHFPVNGCSVASYNFGILAGEDECMSFCSTILGLIFTY